MIVFQDKIEYSIMEYQEYQEWALMICCMQEMEELMELHISFKCQKDN